MSNFFSVESIISCVFSSYLNPQSDKSPVAAPSREPCTISRTVKRPPYESSRFQIGRKTSGALFRSFRDLSWCSVLMKGRSVKFSWTFMSWRWPFIYFVSGLSFHVSDSVYRLRLLRSLLQLYDSDYFNHHPVFVSTPLLSRLRSCPSRQTGRWAGCPQNAWAVACWLKMGRLTQLFLTSPARERFLFTARFSPSRWPPQKSKLSKQENDNNS